MPCACSAMCNNCGHEVKIEMPSHYERYREIIKASSNRYYHQHKDDPEFKRKVSERGRRYYLECKARKAAQQQESCTPPPSE